MEETIRAVIRTLNTITVSGADNMNKILGCIQALQELLKVEKGEKKDG